VFDVYRLSENRKTDPQGRFRYWLLGDRIQKDGATILITESSPPELGNARYHLSISKLQTWFIRFYMSIILVFRCIDSVSFVIPLLDELLTKGCYLF